jgi:HlyD family secretion protein
VVKKRSVVTGLNTLEALEITTGLEENETIILNAPPDQPLTEGMTVVPSAPGSPASPDAESLE